MPVDAEPEPEVEIYVDEQGRTVRRFPPAYLEGGTHGPSAMPKGYVDFDAE